MASLPAIWESFPARQENQDRRGSARSRLFALVDARGVNDPLWAWDIGLGGMQCRSRAPRWPGTYLDLSFTLPGTTEKLEVGSQVLSIDQLEDDSLSLGLKFCMLSAKDQRVIYRFLDQRRALWSAEPIENAPRTPQAKLAQWVAGQHRPFEPMLLEAYAQLRAKQIKRLAFVRGINPADLPRLSDLVG
jgi:hypothetical protein